MKLISIFLILFLCLPLTSCKNQLSEKEATEVMQEFVNNNVRFYVNESDSVTQANRADIRLVETQKQDNIYNFILSVASNETGESKNKMLVVSVDSETGQVINMREFKLDQLR